MEKIVLKAYHFICGIAASAEDPAKNPALDLTIDGTGFFLDNMTVITAGHVMKANNGYILQGLPESKFQYIKIDPSTVEHFNELDICIFKLFQPADNVAQLLIDKNQLNMLDDVMTFGYPFAVDNQKSLEIRTRAFKGHITSTYDLSKKKVYELSFHCPRMLSGAPLITIDQEGLAHLRGVILGNEMTDITVDKSKYIEKNPEKEYTIERVESFHRGIALQTISLAERFSNLLKCKIEDFKKPA